MKNLFFSLGFLLIAVRVAMAQPDYDRVIYEFGQWTTEDKTAFVFADISNVRQSPDVKSEIIGKLPAGTEVTIQEVSSVEYVQQGITSSWIRIEVPSVNGYIWGGSLTKGVLRLKDGNIAMWGLTSIQKVKDEADKVLASIRVVGNGIVQSKSDFEVLYADLPDQGYLTLYGAPELDDIQHMLVFETLSEACGVYASSHYFLYAEGKLHHAGSGYSMGDGGLLHTSRTFVFPYPMKEGEYRDYHFSPDPGHVVCIENEGGYDDDCIWVDTRRVSDFTWNGSALVKSCKAD